MYLFIFIFFPCILMFLDILNKIEVFSKNESSESSNIVSFSNSFINVAKNKSTTQWI